MLTEDITAGDDVERPGYRARLRAWLDEHDREAPPRRVPEPTGEDEMGRYGGCGGSPAEQVIVEQELERRGVVGPFDFVGVGMIGPTLLVHGTEAQCERHL